MRGLVYFGDDWSKYTSRYIPKNQPPPTQTQRVIELSRLINRADDATFRQQIESHLAVDEFLRYVAVNSAITNFDSFLSTGHNYYLYINPTDGRCHFIPWDMNLSFGGYTWLGTAEQISATSITHAYADHNRLIERLLAIDSYAAAYRAHMRRLIDGPLSPEKMRNRFAAMAPVFQAAEQAARDAGRAGSAATRPSGGMGFKPPDLLTYIAQRSDSIRQQLDGKQQGFIPGFRDPELVPAEWAAYTAAAVAIINATDTDGDGRLSEAEISAGISQLFAAANLPATGVLEPANTAAAINRLMSDDMRQRTPAASWADWLFSRADANKDGRLDATELLTAYRAQLATEDRDGDGMFGGRELIEALSGARAPRDSKVHR